MAALSIVVTKSLAAQEKTRVVQRIGQDTVVVIPGADFRAGSFHRTLLGDEWRDEWTTPIKVPVLNLATVHGGLKPTKEGGGFQAPNLHFVAADGSEWVFRMLKKIRTNLDPDFDHTVIEWIFRDQGAASHPTALMAAAPLLEAARVLHPSPKLYYMPDDPALGEHRKTFAGVLGELEERPEVPDKGPAFAGAEKIIDSDTLLARINANAKTQIDARQLLTARLMDILFGDNDRHPEQWDWARLSKDDNALWEPIPTDRDKVFVNYEGLLLKIARFVEPSLVKFSSTYPDPTALSYIAVEFDRRLLGTLGKATWDSVANSLMQRITDPVIDNALAQMPPEYARYSAGIATRLKARRNGLRSIADRYYSQLWRVADVHGTDAGDQLNIMRVGDGMVDVVLQSEDKPFFARRFYASETKEIRVYLHGGDDQAVIDGHVRTSIPVRVIGGNGSNMIRDISTVGGVASPTRIYDQGPVTGVKYARDTLAEKAGFDMALNHYFNRRPWVKAYGTLIPPVKDRGGSIGPIFGIHSQHALGIYPVIGLKRYTYGFRKVPYAMKQQADFSYATSGRIRIRAAIDKRFESSDTHIPITGHFSQFEVAQFHGFGNDVPDLRGLFYSVRQKQWEVFPAIGHSFNPESDVSFGPVLRYTTTDSIGNRFITQLHPTGFSTFGQTGLQLKLHLDSRYYPDSLKPRFVLDVAGAGYPGMWDVNTPYESLDGWAAAFFTIPMAKKPVLAFRAGGKKLWGDFPYFDAAFLGGSETYRVESKQRWAGDASLYGSSELRVPIAQFPLVLPLDVGAIAFADMGRVYFNGDSPDGWHTAAGGGFWVGFRDPRKSVTVLFSNRGRHRVVTSFGFAY